MADEWTKQFDQTFGGGDSTDAWSKAFDREFKPKEERKNLKVIDIGKPTWQAVNSVLKFFGDRIDATQAAAMNPLTTKFSTGQSEPLGQSLADLAMAPVTGNPPTGYTRGDAAYEAGIKGGLKPWQARTLSIAGSFPVASALNTVGETALLPAGRALANAEIGAVRTRALPGVKQVLKTFGPSGVTLPNKYRDAYYKILREAEGAADWRGFVREKNLQAGLKLPQEAQDAITHAIETRNIGALPADLQPVANAIRNENRAMIGARIRQGLERGELVSPTNMDYVARVATKEGRLKLGRTPYGTPTEFAPPGLSTSLGKGRSEAGRVMTAEQMFGGSRQGLIEPAVKGTIIKGASNDRAVMHAQIVKALDRQFGRPLQYGEQPISSIRGVPTGFTTGMTKRLKGRSLPPEIHQELVDLNKRFATDESWGKAKEVVNVVNREFRRWALFSPGFVSRNMQNNVVQNVLAGNVEPATWIDATALRARMAAKKLTPEDMTKIEAYVRNGVLGKGQVSMETAKGVGGKYARLFDRWRNVNSFAEDASRMALYDYFTKYKAKAPAEAARLVNVWLFNYSPTFKSQTFNKLRSTAFPFINWRSQVPGLFVRATLERPGSFGQIGNIRSQLNAQAPPDETKALPDYAQQEGATYQPFDIGPIKKGYYSPQAVGQFDVNDIVSNLRAGPPGWARLGVTNAYPQYGVAAGEAAQKDFFLNRPFEYKPGEPRYTSAPAVFKFLAASPEGKQFLKEHQFVVKEDGAVLAPVRTALWLKAFPQLRLANLVADILKPDPRSRGRVLSFAIGLRSLEAGSPPATKPQP